MSAADRERTGVAPTRDDETYQPPELVVYGELRQLTLSVGQSGADNSMSANQMRV